MPCIERNAIAAVKAVNAARMALRRTSEPRVCLDKVIETMYETGKDMNAKYRETSRGGGNEDRCLRLIALQRPRFARPLPDFSSSRSLFRHRMLPLSPDL